MRLLAALSIACAARTAGAERAISVEVQGAPFEARELVDALRVRIAAEGGPVHVRVTGVARGVHVEARNGARDVEIGELRGAEAARLVALATDDLLLDDLVAVPAPAARGERTLAVLGEVAGWTGVLGTGMVELVTPLGPAGVAIAGGGGELVTGKLALYSGVVRVEAVVRRGWLDVRAGAVAVPIVVTSGKGDTTVVAGGGASARVRVPVTDGVRAVLAVGIDAFANRSEYEQTGMPTIATPWVTAWLGLGVEAAL